jgi:phosphotransferase system  glucose/maltose/N-acetylglucosamine-specific IIC component
VYVPAHLVICARVLAIDLRPLLRTLVKALVAALVAAAVLAVVGTSHLTVLGWLGGGAGAIVAYVATLIGTGEVTSGELAGIARVIGGRLGLQR